MTNNSRQRPLFTMGQIFMTTGAETALDEADQSPFEFLTRHIAGDWGELPIEDLNANQEAVEHGLRILSRYTTDLGVALYVITEFDRSATTILLPAEY